MFTRKNSMNLLSRFFTVSIAILVFVLFCKYCSEAVIVVSMSLFFATILNKLTINIEKLIKLPRAIIAVVLVFGLFATMLYLMYIMLPLMFSKIMTIVNSIYNGGGKFQKLLLTTIKDATVIDTRVITKSDCWDKLCHMSPSGHKKIAEKVIFVMNFKTQ